jgi:hypothetical protein
MRQATLSHRHRSHPELSKAAKEAMLLLAELAAMSAAAVAGAYLFWTWLKSFGTLYPNMY